MGKYKVEQENRNQEINNPDIINDFSLSKKYFKRINKIFSYDVIYHLKVIISEHLYQKTKNIFEQNISKYNNIYDFLHDQLQKNQDDDLMYSIIIFFLLADDKYYKYYMDGKLFFDKKILGDFEKDIIIFARKYKDYLNKRSKSHHQQNDNISHILNSNINKLNSQ